MSWPDPLGLNTTFVVLYYVTTNVLLGLIEQPASLILRNLHLSSLSLSLSLYLSPHQPFFPPPDTDI